MNLVLYVALGGAIGALARYWAVLFFAEHWLSKYHFATLFVNTLGSFIMLFFMTLFMYKFSFPLSVRLFLATGFLGAFTTFSTFSYETIHLFENGEISQAFLNIFLNNFFAIGAGVGGYYLAKMMTNV